MPLTSIDAKLLRKSYGDAVGPTGTPMPSDAARDLEALLKTLPKACRDLGLLRRCPDVKAMEFADGEHADVSFVTTNSVDRDREVVLAKGGDWKQFTKNPVVTFAHDYSALPVGRCAWVQRDDRKGVDGWKAKTVYAARPADHPAGAEWFPDSVWAFVRDGMLPAKSIGFIALNYREPTAKEVEADKSWANARGVIDKWLALEYAVTPVQSNPDALVVGVAKMRRKGLTVDEFLERAGLIVPDDLQAPDDKGTDLDKVKFAVWTPPPRRDVAKEFASRAASRLAKFDPAAALKAAGELARGRI